MSDGTFRDFSQYKALFHVFNSAVFKVFICENRKLPFLCLKHTLFQQLHMNPKWTATRHSQMVNVAKHALQQVIFNPVHSSMKIIDWILFYFCWVYVAIVHIHKHDTDVCKPHEHAC